MSRYKMPFNEKTDNLARKGNKLKKMVVSRTRLNKQKTSTRKTLTRRTTCDILGL